MKLELQVINYSNMYGHIFFQTYDKKIHFKFTRENRLLILYKSTWIEIDNLKFLSEEELFQLDLVNEFSISVYALKQIQIFFYKSDFFSLYKQTFHTIEY